MDAPHATHSDTVEIKAQLMADARARGDLDLALSLADSIKQSLAMELQQQEPRTQGLAVALNEVASLPAAWRAWAAGWACFTPLVVSEPTMALARHAEPVSVVLDIPAACLSSPRRELRVALVKLGQTGSGDRLPSLSEVPCQVLEYSMHQRIRTCRLLFAVDSPAGGIVNALILYGNPAAEVPVPTANGAPKNAFGSPLRALLGEIESYRPDGSAHALPEGSALGGLLDCQADAEATRWRG